MRKQARAPLSAAAACVAFVLASLAPASAQEIATANASQSPPSASPAANPPSAHPPNRVTNADIMEVPLVNNIPGAVLLPAPANPMANDPQAAQRGMKYFEAMNCVGCHAPNGAGGMGPSLSDASRFKFGSEPARLFAVISHGAPLGMPAWGSVLPNDVIWDIVSYIESINKDPQAPWGHTFKPWGQHAGDRTNAGRIRTVGPTLELPARVQQREKTIAAQSNRTQYCAEQCGRAVMRARSRLSTHPQELPSLERV